MCHMMAIVGVLGFHEQHIHSSSLFLLYTQREAHMLYVWACSQYITLMLLRYPYNEQLVVVMCNKDDALYK